MDATSDMHIVQPKKVLKINLDYQDSALSCEAAALKMALAGQGVHVSEQQIMKLVGYDPTPHKGSIWGDPDRAFVGNIAGKQNTTGYGVHWIPILHAARRWRPAQLIAKGTAQDIASAVNNGDAVVVWGTLGRARRDQWRTPHGKIIRAWKGEHARTVIGFYGTVDHPTHFIINDPVVGRLTWTTSTFMNNWTAFDHQAVIVR
jgi:uncharacterized protein YvpB